MLVEGGGLRDSRMSHFGRRCARGARTRDHSIKLKLISKLLLIPWLRFDQSLWLRGECINKRSNSS